MVIGSSTGGPAAVADVLGSMPDAPDFATVIVQHVDVAFAAGLARWLLDKTGRRVHLAESGDKPLPGQVYLAATNDHVVLDDSRRFRYVSEPTEVHYRPSVDVFFKSVAALWPEPGAAALLTGMGRDGAQGLLELRRAGWLTIAQDEATSVIWGCPAPPCRSAPPTASSPWPRSPGPSPSGPRPIPPTPRSPSRMSNEPALTQHKVTVLLVDDQP